MSKMLLLLELFFSSILCFGFAKEVILLGSSGLVGGLVLQDMLAHPAWSKIHTLVRKPSTIRHPKLNEIVVPDMTKMKTDPQLLKFASSNRGRIDAAIATLGINEPFGWKFKKLLDIEVGLNSAFATFCRSQLGVKYMGVMTAAGSERGNPFTGEELETEITYSNMFSVLPRFKGEVEDAVLAAAFPHTSFFRPAQFETDEYRFGFLDVFLQYLCSVMNFFVPTKYHSIHVRHIAKAMSEDAVAVVTTMTEGDVTDTQDVIHNYDEMMALVGPQNHVEL